MDSESYQPIETAFGVLIARDAISLSDTYYDGANLILRIGLNGRLGSIPKNEFRNYKLSFTDVIAFTVTSLDLWHHQLDLVETDSIYEVTSGSDSSSFDEVLNSTWLRKWKNDAIPLYHHYCIGTYDNIFNIVCQSYVLTESIESTT